MPHRGALSMKTASPFGQGGLQWGWEGEPTTPGYATAVAAQPVIGCFVSGQRDRRWGQRLPHTFFQTGRLDSRLPDKLMLGMLYRQHRTR